MAEAVETDVAGFHADLLINFLLWIFGFLPGLLHGLYIVIKYANPKSRHVAGQYDIDGSRHAPSPSPAIGPAVATANETSSGIVESRRPLIHPFLAETTYAPTEAASSTGVSPSGFGGVDTGHGVSGGAEGGLPLYEEHDGGARLKQAILRGDTKR